MLDSCRIVLNRVAKDFLLTLLCSTFIRLLNRYIKITSIFLPHPRTEIPLDLHIKPVVAVLWRGGMSPTIPTPTRYCETLMWPQRNEGRNHRWSCYSMLQYDSQNNTRRLQLYTITVCCLCVKSCGFFFTWTLTAGTLCSFDTTLLLMPKTFIIEIRVTFHLLTWIYLLLSHLLCGSLSLYRFYPNYGAFCFLFVSHSIEHLTATGCFQIRHAIVKHSNSCHHYSGSLLRFMISIVHDLYS